MSGKKLQKKNGRCRDMLNRLVGWLNVATSPEGCTAVDARKLREYNHRLGNEVDFYKRRCEVLQTAQKTMRDPERKMVCDVLANGHLAPNYTPNDPVQPPCG